MPHVRKIDAKQLNHSCPFISVITVSLDAEATIEDTVASVSMQQANFDFEHVCVDGGSTDSTRRIIDRWAERNRRITRIYERDFGIFDAMNKGLRAAAGEYVLYLNADDFLVAPDTLATAMAGLTPGGDNNPDLIVGDVAMGFPGSRGFWRHRRVPRSLGRLRGTGLFPVHSAQFTKRSLLQSVGGFDSRLRLASDVTQYYDLERAYRPSVRVVRRNITLMRPGGSANANLKAMQLGTVEIYRHLVPTYGRMRAAAMVSVKTMQSLSEIRYGRCPHNRWFDGLRDGGGAG
jgi:glycosyltransferase involved in cell wall biosynthesis